MRLVTVSGPPASGKTSVILHMIPALRDRYGPVGVVKLDCLATDDDARYRAAQVPCTVGISGNLCPDHFFATNLQDCLEWAAQRRFGLLIVESAGLCNRCSPHVQGCGAVCVVDNLLGVNAPRKIGPMLKMADTVCITKGDVVSQAEREVFAFHVRKANPGALILQVNGLTGQGCAELAGAAGAGAACMEEMRLRFNLPAAVCAYCLGEKRVGKAFQLGNVRRMQFDGP